MTASSRGSRIQCSNQCMRKSGVVGVRSPIYGHLVAKGQCAAQHGSLNFASQAELSSEGFQADIVTYSTATLRLQAWPLRVQVPTLPVVFVLCLQFEDWGLCQSRELAVGVAAVCDAETRRLAVECRHLQLIDQCV